MRLGSRGGHLALTGVYDDRGPANRMQQYRGPIYAGYNNPGAGADPADDITDGELQRRGLARSDFNGEISPAQVQNLGVIGNASLPVGRTGELYGFGGYNFREASSATRYVLPNEAANVESISPDGFLPRTTAEIEDRSLALGLRGALGRWEYDLSNVYGSAGNDYRVDNTLNAALLEASPRAFAVGSTSFAQNSAEATAYRYLPRALQGISLRFGGTFRYEDYRIRAGDPDSYATNGATASVLDPLGRRRPGGVQGFMAYRPEDAVTATRNAIGGYTMVEVEFTEKILLTAGGRYENYSDAGNALAGKLSARIALNRALSLRGSISSNYRAPSLHQIHYGASTLQVGGEDALRSGIYRNTSEEATALSIGTLSPETSVNLSGGITANLPEAGLSLQLDGFLINAENRVVLTEPFGRDPARPEVGLILARVGAAEASFFANAIETQTVGVNATLAHRTAPSGKTTVTSSVAVSYAQTDRGAVKTSSVLADQEALYVSGTSRLLIEYAVPRLSAIGLVDADFGKLNGRLRVTYFGPVQQPVNFPSPSQSFDGKVVVDASLGWRIARALRLSAGVHNLLDAYPDLQQPERQDDGRLLYSNSVSQLGTTGRYAFGRLSLDF